MQFGIVASAGGPRDAAILAAEAESHGWDGIFTWDGVAIDGTEIAGPPRP